MVLYFPEYRGMTDVSDSDVRILVTDIVKSFDTVYRGILGIGPTAGLGSLAGFGLRILNIMPRLGFGYNSFVGLVKAGPGMGAFLKGAR